MKYKLLEKFLITILSILLLSSSIYISFANSEDINILGDSAILIDLNNSNVIFEKNPDKIEYPASLVKILTAIIIIEECDLNDKVTIDTKSPFVDGSKMYLTPGEILSVENLLNAMMIKSANDAANALAIYHSGSIEKFVEYMNTRATELGTKNSVFTNTNGLHNSKQVTTARDMSIIAKHAITLPKFLEIVKKSKMLISPTNKQDETRVYKNTNRFLWGTGSKNKMNYKGNSVDIKYDIVNGVKIGSTYEAKQCLVVTASLAEKNVMGVILKSTVGNIYPDGRAIIDYGIYDVESKILISKDEYIDTIFLENERKSKIDLFAQENINSYISKNKSIDINKEIIINDNLKLPIEKDQILGKITVSSGEDIIGQTNLISKISISDKELLSDKTTNLTDKKNQTPLKKYAFIALKLFLVFLLWRSIMTIFNIKKEKKNNA